MPQESQDSLTVWSEDLVLTPADYRLALDVQNAVNVSGIVQSFVSLIARVWEESHARVKAGHYGGTQFVNTHPITVLFVDKLSTLARTEEMGTFSRAYNICTTKSEVKETE